MCNSLQSSRLAFHFKPRGPCFLVLFDFKNTDSNPHMVFHKLQIDDDYWLRSEQEVSATDLWGIEHS